MRLFLLFAIPFVLVLGLLTAEGWSLFMRAGMCSAAAPDIPAEACTFGEFMERTYFSFYAIGGEIIIGLMILGAAVIIDRRLPRPKVKV